MFLVYILVYMHPLKPPKFVVLWTIKKQEILIANYLTIRILSKSGRRGSNPRPSAWKANALSTELLPQKTKDLSSLKNVGKDGFEPPKSKDSRFTVCPIWPLWYLPNLLSKNNSFSASFLEPLVGFEPTTPRLQITCSGQLS